MAYAIINDVPEVTRKHFLKNEGVQILSYDTQIEGFAGFDRILKAIHDQTNPAFRFGKLLEGASILWIDHPAADGHRLTLRGADLVRVIDGRITDIHHVENVLATLRQIGS